MTLKTFVKVGGVNNLSDARYCAGMGVNVIGFNIDPNQGEVVDADKFGEISSWLAGVNYAAEGDMLTEMVVSTYKVQYVESSEATQLALLPSDYKKIYKIDIEAIDTVEGNFDYILVEGPDKLTDAELESLKSLASNHRILIACGFDHNNVLDVLNKTGAYGIAIKAGDEIRPGYKDYDELADILEKLETDN